jgi:hypothetical protein
MAATKIMIIPHAERPPDDGSINGVTLSGTKEPEDLIVRGWQRAGALVRLFAPAGGHFVNGQLATPDVIFASKVAHHSPSLRPQNTLILLADFLHKSIVQTRIKGEENALAPKRLRPLVRWSSRGSTRRFQNWVI